MKRDNYTLQLDLGHELVVDNFAGGGGASTGIEDALGRPVDIAINHDPEALAMHAINHPYTRHLLQSVWDVDPIAVTGNQPLGLVWLSPDCKHFSKAKGGTPVSKHIRGLAWIGMRWVALTRPRILMLENVEEFTSWGPLVVDADGNARPDPKRKGKTFESFVRQLRQHGYAVEWKERRACNSGAPTIRKRLFLIARRDGLPIVWPKPTHGDPKSTDVIHRRMKPWRTAAECIDFDLPAESIFGRKKALAENTMRRVAKGLWSHVLTNAEPFIVNTRNGEREGQQPRVRNIHEPYWTCTAQGSQGAVIQPTLTPFITEHANSSNQRTMPADSPLRTVCAQVKGGHFSIVAPMMAPLRGTDESRGGHPVQHPLSTISAGGTHHALVSAFLEQANGGFYDGDGRALSEPMSTVTSTGSQQRLVTAYLVKYYSCGGQHQKISDPMHTLPTKARMGLVQVIHIPSGFLAPELLARAQACAALLHRYLPEHFPDPADVVLVGDYVLIDITLRMLKPRELYRAQGFPERYIIDEIPDPALLFKDGVQATDPLSVPRIKLSATAQVRMCGNSVSPPEAEELVRANFRHEQRIAA
ncbi:DNA cytosine methyltransferase [Uliginosibacterium sediminicola]|uniref:DNA (cytosine-5-)-methyltransferase n=1 Tax=Uliginosibacterium sediminicola TaxID=2024550 RepID=A0ABU9YVX6_9RHOO